MASDHPDGSNRGRGRLSIDAKAWALFQGGRDSYIVLVSIYIFLPYLASVVIGDPVEGQERVSRWATYSSLLVMITAPLLGAVIDKLGGRKAGLAILVALMAPLTASLWATEPDGSGLGATGALIVITLVGILFAYIEVLHNSLLVHVAGVENAHRASGLGSGLSNGVGLLALIFCLWAFVLPGKVPAPWIPAAPLLGLDPALHEPERIAGPIAGLLFVLGSLPFFLLTSDVPGTGRSFAAAIAAGAAELGAMVKAITSYRDAAVFLGARMFFVDGMTAISLYVGIYAAGVMGWGAQEMPPFGIVGSLFAALGGFVGPRLDSAFGPKKALLIEVGMTFVGLVALIGIGPGHIFYFWDHPNGAPPMWDGPIFTTLPEWLFLTIAFATSTFIVAHYASSRTLLIRLTPPEQTGAFFGLFALSGTATLWLGSLLVNFGTRVFQSQQAGFAMIAGLLALGWIFLLFVRGGGRLADRPEPV